MPDSSLPKSFIFNIFLYISLLLVTSAPPCPVVTILCIAKEKLPITPNVPKCLPLYVEPRDWAASSIKNSFLFLHKATKLSILGERPLMVTKIIAFVFLVIAFFADSKSKHKFSGSISTKTGFAPANTTALAEAIIV